MTRWIWWVLALLIAERAYASPPCCDDSIFERAGMAGREP